MTAIDLSSGGTINNNQWHHILAQREADGSGQIYIDGLPDGVITATARTILESGVAIGADGVSADKFFNGTLDEVTLYTGALSEDEIYYLANPLYSTISGVQVRFRSYAERDIAENDGTWNPASLTTSSQNFATWSASVPSLSPGNYKIDLKATDSHGNTRYIGEAWTGAYLQHDLQITATTAITQVGLGGQIAYSATYSSSTTSVTTATDVALTLAVPTD